MRRASMHRVAGVHVDAREIHARAASTGRQRTARPRPSSAPSSPSHARPLSGAGLAAGRRGAMDSLLQRFTKVTTSLLSRRQHVTALEDEQAALIAELALRELELQQADAAQAEAEHALEQAAAAAAREAQLRAVLEHELGGLRRQRGELRRLLAADEARYRSACAAAERAATEAARHTAAAQAARRQATQQAKAAADAESEARAHAERAAALGDELGSLRAQLGEMRATMAAALQAGVRTTGETLSRARQAQRQRRGHRTPAGERRPPLAPAPAHEARAVRTVVVDLHSSFDVSPPPSPPPALAGPAAPAAGGAARVRFALSDDAEGGSSSSSGRGVAD